MIYLETDNGEKTARLVKDMKEVTAVRPSSRGLAISLSDEGQRFMPKLVERVRGEKIEIKSVNLKKPTLDDVFMHFTGRGLREGEQEKKKNNIGNSGGGH